jgi:hypothetical protein
MEKPVSTKLSTLILDQGESDVSFEEPELNLIVKKGSKTIPFEQGEPIKITGSFTISF